MHIMNARRRKSPVRRKISHKRRLLIEFFGSETLRVGQSETLRVVADLILGFRESDQMGQDDLN